MGQSGATSCAAARCKALVARSHKAGGGGGRRTKYVHPDHLIALKQDRVPGDPICDACFTRDWRMRQAADSSESEHETARQVARITTERRSLSFSTAKPPAASTRSAQKAVDMMKWLSAAAINTPSFSPTRIVRLTSDERLLPSPSQLVVMPLVHYVTLAHMLTCGQVSGTNCIGQLKLLEEPRITAGGPVLKMQCCERGCGAIHMLPDQTQPEHGEDDRMVALRTHTAVVGAGMGYSAYESFMIGIGAHPISEKRFYAAQKEVEPVVEKMSNDIMQSNRNDVKELFEGTGTRTDVAVDGSWSQWLNAHHGATTIMTFPDQRILAMEIMSKKLVRTLADGRQSTVNSSNYEGSSQAMEVVGAGRALRCLAEAKVLPAISTWITDLGHVVKNIKKRVKEAGGEGIGFKTFPDRVSATIMRLFKRVAVSEPKEQRADLLRTLLKQVVPHYTTKECRRGCFCQQRRRQEAGTTRQGTALGLRH
jgi:hypothetical protein